MMGIRLVCFGMALALGTGAWERGGPEVWERGGPEARKLGGTEARKLGGTGAGKLGGTEAWKLGGTGAGERGGPEAGKLGGTEAWKLGDTEAPSAEVLRPSSFDFAQDDALRVTRGTNIPFAQDDKAERELVDSTLDWKEIVSKEGSFRVSFPTEPKYTVKQSDSGAGRLTHHIYSLEEGPISWLASWVELPPKHVRDTGTVAILQGAQEACFKRFKGRVLSEKVIQLGVAQGRDVVFQTEDDVKLRLRVYLRGMKLVQALVICEPDLMDGSDVKRFFDSFKWE